MSPKNMFRHPLAITLFSIASYAAPVHAGYQSEVALSFGSEELDGGQTLQSEALILGQENAQIFDETTQYSLQARYHFEEVDDAEGPKLEAPFLAKADFVALEFNAEERDFERKFESVSDEKDTMDSTSISASVRYHLDEKKRLVEAALTKGSTEISSTVGKTDTDHYNFEIGVGTYLESNELVIARLIIESQERVRSNGGTSKEASYFAELYGKHILKNTSGAQLAVEGAVTLGEKEENNYSGFSYGFDLLSRLYITKQFSLLAGMSITKFDSKLSGADDQRTTVDTEYQMGVQHFFNDDFSLFLGLNRTSNRASHRGRNALLEREKLVGGDIRVRTNYRF